MTHIDDSYKYDVIVPIARSCDHGTSMERGGTKGTSAKYSSTYAVQYVITLTPAWVQIITSLHFPDNNSPPKTSVFRKINNTLFNNFKRLWEVRKQ